MLLSVSRAMPFLRNGFAGGGGVDELKLGQVGAYSGSDLAGYGAVDLLPGGCPVDVGHELGLGTFCPGENCNIAHHGGNQWFLRRKG